MCVLCSLLMRGDAGCLNSVGLHWYRACLSLVWRASPYFLPTALIAWGQVFCISSCRLCMYSIMQQSLMIVQHLVVFCISSCRLCMYSIMQQSLMIVQHLLVFCISSCGLCMYSIMQQSLMIVQHPLAFCISSCGLCMYSTYESLYATVQTD